MNRLPRLTILPTLAALSLAIAPTQAVQFPDGRTAFSGASPRLDNTTATVKTVGARNVRYYFTLTLPVGAEEPLQQLMIEQRRGEQTVEFELAATTAFRGDRGARGQELALARVEGDRRTVTVEFATPIPPGTTFTVGLRPRQNPRWGGTYLFGVTVFPAGAQPQGLFLGSGRLQFYERDRDFFFR
ncbi:MAG: DUF2808 domain-containing protein [Spirulinaceae cyanobacterium RM2_2_10]|nr:DUF2808 domain-containing protein [Spirulinaceae cyanobacterium SM2_1_0]NJO21317.1 DUF2808 domain-containing protein [Spirulinaceae cyanobacterium RM2_2_10]